MGLLPLAPDAILTDAKKTLPIAMSSIMHAYTIEYGALMVIVCISTLPVLILFLTLQKQFVAGLLGSVKLAPEENMSIDLFHSRNAWESPEVCGEGQASYAKPPVPCPSAEAARRGRFGSTGSRPRGEPLGAWASTAPGASR